METHENPYKREELKSQLLMLEQKIAQIDAGGKPAEGETLADLHQQYEQLQAQLSNSSDTAEPNELEKAA